MKLYNELAEYYYTIEKGNRHIDNDIKLIKLLLKDKKKPLLLDLGCGTGEHLDRLVKLNIDCTGIDSSEAMIRIAKRRFPSVKFIKEDMRTFNFTNKFDVIISLHGSFDYQIEDEEINRVFENTRKALKTHGIGLFEIWNAVPIKKIKKKPLTLISKNNYNNKTIARERGFKLLNDQNKTVVEVKYNYCISGGGTNKIIKDKHLMRAFTRDEIIHYLENNELYPLAFYSNSLMEAYTDTSNKIIGCFEKK